MDLSHAILRHHKMEACCAKAFSTQTAFIIKLGLECTFMSWQTRGQGAQDVGHTSTSSTRIVQW